MSAASTLARSIFCQSRGWRFASQGYENGVEEFSRTFLHHARNLAKN